MPRPKMVKEIYLTSGDCQGSSLLLCSPNIHSMKLFFNEYRNYTNKYKSQFQKIKNNNSEKEVEIKDVDTNLNNI